MPNLPLANILRHSASLFTLFVTMSAGSVAIAQDNAPEISSAKSDDNRRTVYQADFFTQYAPTNALDIVRRVPGFLLDRSNNDVRGFSGTAGNVVFNDARPSSKSESLEAILARIPAQRVLRVEVASGDVFGSDYAGKSQVLNVVMSNEGGVDGNVKLSLTRIHHGPVIPNLDASALIRSGSSTFNISAGSKHDDAYETGYDVVRRFSDGEQIEFRDKVNDISPKDPFVAASWSHEGSTGSSEHINIRYAPSQFKLLQTNHVTPAIGAVRDDLLEQNYHTGGYELGGDISRPFVGGAIKFVALGNRRERDNFDASYNRIADVTIGGFEQYQDALYDEVLGRLSWSHPKLLGFSTEIGSELAYNKLENATELYLLGPGGVRTRLDLPIDRATVDEIRTESYVNLGRQLTNTLRLDTSFAFETSRLNVGGDTSAERSLNFFKPGITLDWKNKRELHVQGAFRRKVAQLDFYDFISSAELANDRVNGGNADLLPQRSWEARLTVEQPVLEQGLIKLVLGHDWVSLLQDRILTSDGFDAPGNIGSGTRKFARLTFDSPLDRLGFAATRLKIDGGVQETKVRDPLTGEIRPRSGFYSEWDWRIELRRDLALWSYGVTISDSAPGEYFRTDEIDRFFNNRPYGTAFVEFRPEKRSTIRLDLDNILDSSGQRSRLFFSPNRTSGAPLATEFRQRNRHIGLTLSVNRTFGGGAAAG